MTDNLIYKNNVYVINIVHVHEKIVVRVKSVITCPTTWVNCSTTDYWKLRLGQRQAIDSKSRGKYPKNDWICMWKGKQQNHYI